MVLYLAKILVFARLGPNGLPAFVAINIEAEMPVAGEHADIAGAIGKELTEFCIGEAPVPIVLDLAFPKAGSFPRKGSGPSPCARNTKASWSRSAIAHPLTVDGSQKQPLHQRTWGDASRFGLGFDAAFEPTR
jgi:hypothetical protein